MWLHFHGKIKILAEENLSSPPHLKNVRILPNNKYYA
jgi:hypothetical protein